MNNVFRLFGAFQYNKIRSNSTYKLYEANGGVLSLKNLTNETALQQCIRQACDY